MVLRRFSVSAGANLMAVGLGLFKQYLIATTLTVVSFGAYGTATTWAALMAVLIPFPSYLRLLSQGLSAGATEHELRQRLKQDAAIEFLGTSALCLLVFAFLWAQDAVRGNALDTLSALALLTLAQYFAISSDIVLRMEDRHNRIALLQTLRNAPVIGLLLILPFSTPSMIALAELVSILVVAGAIRGWQGLAPAWPRWRNVRTALRMDGSSLSLWGARIFQALARNAARLAVPLFFSGMDVGLFFFALIAQAPSSILLSVSSQVFGRTLATAGAGDLQTLLKAQIGYAIPNLMYGMAVLFAMPFWDRLIALSPSLAKYDGASGMVLAAVFVGCVQASDCLEFMLFKNRRSRVLLAYNILACTLQFSALAICNALGLTLAHTLYVVGTLTLLVTASATSFVFWSVTTGRWK